MSVRRFLHPTPERSAANVGVIASDAVTVHVMATGHYGARCQCNVARGGIGCEWDRAVSLARQSEGSYLMAELFGPRHPGH